MKYFKIYTNAFDSADGILVVGYDVDGKEQDDTLERVLHICRQVNLKLNKGKCHVRCTSVPFFGEVISRHGVKPDTQKLKALTEMPPPNNKKELQTFLGIINCLSKFSPSTVDICESLRQLKSSKTQCTWNATYQNLFDKGKSIITLDVYMKFYDETQLVYLETDTFGIRLKSCPTTNQKWYKLPMRQSTRQQHSQTHHLCKHKPVMCRKKIQPH